jgi:hypothetical protein
MKRSLSRSLPALLALALFAVLIAALAGCGQQSSLVTAPDTSPATSSVATLKVGAPELNAAFRAQEASTPGLMRIAGVVGTATTADDQGRPAILVLTEASLGAGRLPAVINGYRVIEEVTGKIIAYKGGGGGVSHTAKQTPPIQLGTSGGNVNDIANGYCCSGTLGALVSKGGAQYILSNSHVFAGDVVSGGNGRVATLGDDINQPGLVDNNCSAANTNIVADLSSLSTLYPPGSTPNVDCAIAQVRAGMVRTDGAILEVGTISASTVAASMGQAVKKSGRTTGLTRSSISGLNATVNVGYETECAGTSFTKTFTGQILVTNRSSRFLNSGDSGSLMVEDVTTNPRAVGLLYAGGGGIAVANPIGAVLSHLGASMVGQ